MSTEQWVEAIVAVAVALGLRELLPGLVAWLTGRASREKARVQELMRERDAAEDERDEEAVYRRKVEEMGSALRRIALEAGVPAEDLPAWPQRSSTPEVPPAR